MLRFSTRNIHMGSQAANKEAAIGLVADALMKAENVGAGYVDSMLAREQQISTFLGNGIAIPHGTLESRQQILRTGIEIFQFPQGILWGDSEKAYIVIGIAAKSDEHLDLLRQLTHVLSDETKAERLKMATNAEELWALLTEEQHNSVLMLDSRMVMRDLDVSDLETLQAINAARLKAVGAADDTFVTHVITRPPLNLGQGIWLNDSPEGNLASAISVSCPRHSFSVNGTPVAMLITVAAADEQPLPILKRLSHLLQEGNGKDLLKGDAASLIVLLTHDQEPDRDLLSDEFIVRNVHGLHTRPGSVLVNVIKQFTSTVTVSNLDGTGQAVNGRSMMKVVGLGVKNGHRLRVTAQGEDARQALDAIGEAIANGLGEGV